jgi:hypothetical protein
VAVEAAGSAASEEDPLVAVALVEVGNFNLFV